MDFCGGGVEVCESHSPEQGYAHRSENVSSNAEGYSCVVLVLGVQVSCLGRLDYVSETGSPSFIFFY